MTEYLINYKKLLELEDINEKEIQENEQIIRENYQKWSNTKDKEETLDSEIKVLNKKYDDEMLKKEKRFFNKLTIILIFVSIIIFFILSTINPIFIMLGPPLLWATSSIIYLLTFLINKTTCFFEKQFHKDKNISELLQQIKTKEKELSDIKKLCDEYGQNIIKYRAISKKLEKKKLWITDSINELMRNYATPIFEEQLKNIDEEQLETSKTKTKKKIKINGQKEQ